MWFTRAWPGSSRRIARCAAADPPGYTTCAWHTVRTALILFDRSGWFARLQAWSDQSYPPALRRAIISHNLPILRGIVPSYRDNLEKSSPGATWCLSTMR